MAAVISPLLGLGREHGSTTYCTIDPSLAPAPNIVLYMGFLVHTALIMNAVVNLGIMPSQSTYQRCLLSHHSR